MGSVIKTELTVEAGGPDSIGTPGFAWTTGQKVRTAISGVIIAILLSIAFLLSKGENASTAPISLLIGISLGLLLERGRFCFFCIFRDVIEDRNTTPLISVFTAIVVGAIGYGIVFGQFLPDTSTDRLPPVAHIGPVSWPLALAAFLFGIGMTLSGACISGHLYRLGQGYLRAIPALLGTLIGFAIAFLTWNWLYLNAIADAPTIWLPHTFGYGGSILITFIAVTALFIFAIKWGKNSEPISKRASGAPSISSGLRYLIFERWNPIATGALVGVIGMIAYLRVEPLGVTRQISTSARTFMENQSLADDTLLGLDQMAGCIAVVSEAITNNGWLIFGIVFASFAAALAGGRFKFSRLTPRNTGTALLGGIFLGWGSMTSLGCTIGVLLSGTQAFALSGWVFFAFVFLGTVVGVKLKLHNS